ncbi:carboxypeptidase regulatory-like domain-containing protein [Streptomyces sp. NBC_01387]|uniref:kelch repeat-containing protein n=1 Tax=unclassified Streptomyces TaxID=2593676 RepID=UPI002DDA15E6|nr:kelch repeat-containing protein [Streptomyces sp. NBC_01766]WSC24216.1 carboxypeptidase regulatory-like domain-containing protein [Streptomyces sp. NBC_01766]WSV58102.1 carboxypeptidase regulatory-like domain-containing protein [Streptomyces sp. NBC_01014]
MRPSRGRIRARTCLLLAGCLGFAVLSAGPASADPATRSGSAPTAPEAPAGGLDRPDYAPAGCNSPDVAQGVARCFAMVRTGSNHAIRSAVSGPPATALGPADIKAAYHLPDGGEGRTVAIVDAFGDSHAEDDLAAFRKHYGLPACTTANGCFRKVDQNGGTDYPADDTGWATETALDIDAVSAACPACKILLVQGDSADVNDLGAGVDTAVRLGAKYVSNSYGIAGETPEEATYDQHYDHPGVAITASTGDTGHVQNWPAVNPRVVSVGGTTLVREPGSDRGWDESAWASGGSGCSLYEAEPAYQQNLVTGCDTRSTADISADADPASGLGIYDTLGSDGWLQVGGTSLSSPLVAAMYALAGDPEPGTYPVTYPYLNGTGLNDVTKGGNDSDGTCEDITCTAGDGYDGPTGLGTPDGLRALTFGVSGTLTGRITDKASGDPVAGATVLAEDKADGRSYHTLTGPDGRYTLPAAVGTYDVTASVFGYGRSVQSGVEVTKDTSTGTDLALSRTPSHRVTGKVTDNSGHGWPLYAGITVDGYPYGTVFTDPATGKYSVDLPDGATYRLHVTPVSPGYERTDLSVPVDTADVRSDVKAVVDRATCVAPGYSFAGSADFEGWTGTEAGKGWSVTGGGAAHGWEFDAPGNLPNLTGGDGNFAAAAPLAYDSGSEDTTLVSPVVDLRGRTPELQLDTAYLMSDTSSADIDVTTDGGRTWTTEWHGAESAGGHLTVPLPHAADRSRVQVRFHYKGSGTTLWQIDDIHIGSCTATPGALLTGTVSDANTGKPVNGATVTDKAASDAPAVSTATPDDQATADGRYTLFVPGTGRHTLATAAARYATSTRTVKAGTDQLAQVELPLQTGHVVATSRVSLDAEQGRRATRTVTLTNTGRAPVRVALGEQTTAPSAGSAAPSAWRTLADYPEPVMDNIGGTYQGKLYSVGGINRVVGATITRHGYVHDPASDSWSRISDLPEPLSATAGGFLDGTLYVAGGIGGDEQQPRSAVYAYHPASNSWTKAADLPTAVATAGSAVIDGKLYVVGGCTGESCATPLASLYRYDPAADHWTRLADRPLAIDWAGCAGVSDAIDCVGGYGSEGATAAGYSYHPRTNTWTRLPDAPFTAAAASVVGANGRLQVMGGYEVGASLRDAAEYDPVSNRWTRMPATGQASWRAASACGLYRIGGGGSGKSTNVGTTGAQLLPGYDQCEGDDVSWLSENRTRFTIAPGHSVEVRVTADAGAVASPGRYKAELTVGTDSPYTGQTIAVVLQADPAKGHHH